jgi:hypothetical protein
MGDDSDVGTLTHGATGPTTWRTIMIRVVAVVGGTHMMVPVTVAVSESCCKRPSPGFKFISLSLSLSVCLSVCRYGGGRRG